MMSLYCPSPSTDQAHLSAGESVYVRSGGKLQVISFEEALSRTAGVKRHLLLGNGFSIALFPKRFSYASLLESTDFSAHPEAREAFKLLGTTDFEVVINALRQAVILAPIYGESSSAKAKMSSHADALKELLVQAIAGKHPERPADIADYQYGACRRFLAHFVGDSRGGKPDLRGDVYTLNYDLLLYWTLLHDEIVSIDPKRPLRIAIEVTESLAHDDGFRAPEDNPDAEYVTWDGEASHKQNVHFLHGGLHLFDHGFQLQKKCWERSGGQPLIDQIRSALDSARFPLFVSEGQSKGKLERIRHSGYLHKGLRSFRGNCDQPKPALFIFGHSLAENDAHILRQIEKGKIGQVFISLYGEPESPSNQAIMARAELMRSRRLDRAPMQVYFYDSASTQVWG